MSKSIDTHGKRINFGKHKGKRLADVHKRLFSRVEVKGQDKCWIWRGGNNGNGYGRIWSAGRMVYVHRLSYELLIGEIPEGLCIDHLCRNPLCVNPLHLEAVTHRENILRGTSPNAKAARKTHCKRGHKFTPENTARPQGTRRCRECDRQRSRRYYQRRKAKNGIANKAAHGGPDREAGEKDAGKAPAD